MTGPVWRRSSDGLPGVTGAGWWSVTAPPYAERSAEPAQQGGLGVDVLLDRAALVVHVREVGVAGPEVDGRDAEGREARDVGPALLRVDGDTQRVDEGLGRRQQQARAGAVGRVAQRHVEAVEDLAHVGEGLLGVLVGGVAVVDRDGAPVGDDVAGDAAA